MHMDDVKTWVQLVAWLAPAVAVVYTIYKGSRELRGSTEQRKADLRWKKASAARELIGEIHGNRWGAIAVQILDHGSVFFDYKTDANTPVHVNFESAVQMVGKAQGDCNVEEAFVRDCFDWFFFFIDQIQHYISRDLIDLDDVAHVFRPYARKLAPNREIHNRFMKDHGYDLSLAFWERYQEYKVDVPGAGAMAAEGATAGS